MDLEAVESALRAAVLAAGAGVLEELLRPVGTGRRRAPLRCACGGPMRSTGVRNKKIQTLLGEVRFARSRHMCEACGAVRYPGDEELGIEGASRSPGVQRQVARLGAKEPFHEVARDMQELAGLRICRKEAERISERIGEQMAQWQERERERLRFVTPPPPESPRSIETLYIEFDGTGVPMVPHELAGHKGKQPDGTARTREAKLGCVFTQTSLDSEGRPVRDPGSTSFAGAIENAAAFGQRIYGEAVRRGLYDARRVVVLGDGAQWVKNIASSRFGNATFIVDYYHAAEHAGALSSALFGPGTASAAQYRERWTDLLWEGNIEAILEQAAGKLPRDPKARPEARTEIAYFQKNMRHMRYAHYRKQGFFIGSGVIEAGCKSVIGQRLKQSGMQWTTKGANAIIELRCATLSNRFADYWDQRAA